MENKFNNNQPDGVPNVTNTGYVNPTQQSNGMHPKRNNKKLTAITAVIASVIVVAAVVVCLFALNGKPKQAVVGLPVGTTEFDAKSGVSTTEAEKTTAEKPEPTTFPEPEGGWAKGDVQELAKNITVNGEKISLPCTIGDLRAKGWECDDKIPEVGKNFTRDKIFMNVQEQSNAKPNKFNNFETQLRKYDYSKSFEENTVSNLQFTFYPDSTIDVTVGSFGRGTTYDDLKNCYGELEPVFIKKKDLDLQMYVLRDENIDNYNLIVSFTDGKLYGISIADWNVVQIPKLNDF